MAPGTPGDRQSDPRARTVPRLFSSALIRKPGDLLYGVIRAFGRPVRVGQRRHLEMGSLPGPPDTAGRRAATIVGQGLL